MKLYTSGLIIERESVMDILKELQEIIDRYPKIDKQELTDFLKDQYDELYRDDDTEAYDFGKVIYWFSLRNLEEIIDEVVPMVKEFEEEDQGIQSMVFALEDYFLKKS